MVEMMIFKILLFVSCIVTLECSLSCPRPHNKGYYDITCADGTKCSWYKDGWDCCVGKGGKTNCPPANPFLCSKPNACHNGQDYCCSPHEEGCAKQNAGSIMCAGELTPFSFYGYCRYGDNERNELNDMRKGSPLLCQEWCQKERGCVAFSFDMNARRDCTLYQGGPYTHGWGMYKKNKNVRKCYLMPAETIRN